MLRLRIAEIDTNLGLVFQRDPRGLNDRLIDRCADAEVRAENGK